MLAEFFTSELEGGVSATGLGMAEALGATLGQAVAAGAGAPDWMKFTVDMESGPGAAASAGSRKKKKKKKR